MSFFVLVFFLVFLCIFILNKVCVHVILPYIHTYKMVFVCAEKPYTRTITEANKKG